MGKKNIGSSLFFFLTLRTCSCALTDVFEKNEQATVQNHTATKPFTAEFVAVSEALKTTLTLLIIFEIIVFVRDGKLFCAPRFL